MRVKQIDPHKVNESAREKAKIFKKSKLPKTMQAKKPVEKRIRKTYRFKPGTKALREIRRYQKSTNLLISKLGFQRLVREIAAQLHEKLRFQTSAMLALQEATEAYITEMLEIANLCSLHANRKTLMVKDLKLANRIRGAN